MNKYIFFRTDRIGDFLMSSILFKSIKNYDHKSKITIIASKKNFEYIKSADFVDEVVFDQPLVTLLDENILRISYVMMLTTLLFVIIALLLINSSIRLSIYSKRFIIKTMQLVGATKSFIRRPFIWTHLRLGILSSMIAFTGLAIVFFEINKRFPELNMLEQPVELALVFGGVLFLGIGITGISTFFATQRYLNLKSDAIY